MPFRMLAVSTEAMPPFLAEAQPRNEQRTAGKAKPFRTEGGKAAIATPLQPPRSFRGIDTQLGSNAHNASPANLRDLSICFPDRVFQA